MSFGSSRKGRESINESNNGVVQNFYGGITGSLVAGDKIANDDTTSFVSIGSSGVLADVTVQLPNIKEIDIRGAASVEYLGLSQNDIALDVSGSGDLLLTGVVGIFDVVISGSGSVDATSLTAKTANLAIRLFAIPMCLVLERSNSHDRPLREIRRHLHVFHGWRDVWADQGAVHCTV